MKFVDILDSLNERTGFQEKEGSHKSAKSRVKTYDTIRDALGKSTYGDIFTTDGADRLYVISKGKWGKKSGRGKIAKGFTPGSSTPGSSFSSIKKHATRTKIRYGHVSKSLAKQYATRSMKKKLKLNK